MNVLQYLSDLFGLGRAPQPDMTPRAFKESLMAVSDAFQTALNNLTAAYEAKVAAAHNATAAVQAELDALKAQPPVVDTGPQVDADDTAAVVAATPQG